MSTGAIPDFSTEEIQAVNSTLFERFKKKIETQLADTELRLNPDSSTMTLCPTMYWETDGCHFVVCKMGDEKFHCQFFYGKNEQYGTGIHEYNDIVECIVSLLRVQADHEGKKALSS